LFPYSSNLCSQSSAENNTANSDALRTWWHPTGEINPTGRVQNENVRQSHIYSIQVAAISSPEQFFDSFVYESIPRNGNGNICKPDDPESFCDVDDQISIEADIGVDMAWTQYLANEDTVVRITRSEGGPVDAGDVVIRPTSLEFDITTDGDAILITVPFHENGHRFSVEIKDNLWEYRNAGPGLHSHYVQNKVPDADNYVPEYNDSMPIVGVEPLNALLIFMSPFPEDKYVPDLEKDTYKVPEGLITSLKNVTESTLYFPPGVYWLTGSNHAILSPSITWVYLAPGAYVKGAIQYESHALDLRATGFGVLSGEQYVYQANTAQNYENVKSDNTSLKMWRGESAVGTRWTIHGITTNAPPFNSMDFYGDDLTSFSVDASDYKQVGAFFGQTDGIQMYPGSHVRDVFYHVGDDGIKTYYSNVLCERMTVWKTNNAPIVQFGWYARDTSNVTVDGIQVIHTRYNTQEVFWPRGIVGSAVSYLDQESTSTADVTKHLSNYRITNARCEGICPNLVGINPLCNIDTFLLSNISMEELAPRTTQVGQSTFRVFTDAVHGNRTVALGDNSPDNLGLIIEDFYVGGEKVSFENDNWQSDKLGQIDFDPHWEGRWTVR
jgi:hypothetical protein